MSFVALTFSIAVNRFGRRSKESLHKNASGSEFDRFGSGSSTLLLVSTILIRSFVTDVVAHFNFSLLHRFRVSGIAQLEPWMSLRSATSLKGYCWLHWRRRFGYMTVQSISDDGITEKVPHHLVIDLIHDWSIAAFRVDKRLVYYIVHQLFYHGWQFGGDQIIHGEFYFLTIISSFEVKPLSLGRLWYSTFGLFLVSPAIPLIIVRSRHLSTFPCQNSYFVIASIHTVSNDLSNRFS